MEDVKHAYEILGVTPTMSLEEIENVYECLVDDFLKQNHDSALKSRLLNIHKHFLSLQATSSGLPQEFHTHASHPPSIPQLLHFPI